MNKTFNIQTIFVWIFGLLVMTIGLLNIILVHLVPGLGYIFLSLIYFPPVDTFLQEKLGFAMPAGVKIILGIIIIWFTLGISDLGEMYGF